MSKHLIVMALAVGCHTARAQSTDDATAERVRCVEEDLTQIAEDMDEILAALSRISAERDPLLLPQPTADMQIDVLPDPLLEYGYLAPLLPHGPTGDTDPPIIPGTGTHPVDTE
jgi:hypothetical protein